jgi:hypothetical protein
LSPASWSAGRFRHTRRGHPLIHGAQCLVVFRANAYFRGLGICRAADVWPGTRPGDLTLRLPPNLRHKYSDLAFQLLGAIVIRVVTWL